VLRRASAAGAGEGGFEFRRFRFVRYRAAGDMARMGEDEDVDVNVPEGICLD
jgi:hypothetical protein